MESITYYVHPLADPPALAFGGNGTLHTLEVAQLPLGLWTCESRRGHGFVREQKRRLEVARGEALEVLLLRIVLRLDVVTHERVRACHEGSSEGGSWPCRNMGRSCPPYSRCLSAKRSGRWEKPCGKLANIDA